MVPVGRLIVLRTTPKEKLTAAHRLHYLARSHRAGRGPAAGRLYHHLCQLALDLLPQSPYRHRRPDPDAAVGRERAQRREALPSIGLPFVLAGFASAGAVYGMEKLGSEGVPWQLPGARACAQPTQRGGRHCRCPPQSGHFAHRSGIDEAQDLLAFRLRSERLPHRRFGAAVSATAHVPNRLRLECLSIRPLPAGAVRRRPEYEGVCHPGSSPLWLPPHSHRERNHYRRIHGALRAA